jgi:CHAP domain
MLFIIDEPPKLPNLIETVVIEEKVKTPPKPKKKLIDPQNCEPEMYWAKEHPHYCIPKYSAITASVAEKPARGAENASYGYYPAGQCTSLVASKRPVGRWGDASEWKANAIADGYTHSYKPVKGAIAWRWGHVAYVEDVDGDRVLISEANYDWNGSVRTIWMDASSYEYLF